MTLQNEKKVLLLGIDAASFDIILPLIKQNRLPTFSKLMSEGCWSELKSTMPPISPSAWTSMATGLNPGMHGVFDFISTKFVGGQMESRINTSEVMAGKTYWDYASNVGKRVIVYNHPFTYPPYRVNGLLVSGFPSPLGSTFTFPSRVASKLKELLKQNPEPAKVKESYNISEIYDLIHEIEQIMESQSEVMLTLLTEYKWDLFVAVTTVLDRVQHVLWGYVEDQKTPSHSHANEFQNMLFSVYESLDKLLSKILSVISDDTILILVSDHGFESLRYHYGINNWLEQKGYLIRRRRSVGTTRSSQNILRGVFYSLSHISLIQRLTQISYFTKIALKLTNMMTTAINYHKSIAWCQYPFGISINPRVDRLSPRGHKVITKLIEELKSLRNEETGEQIIDAIYHRDEIYSGDNVDLAPDIVFLSVEGYEPRLWTPDKLIKPLDWSGPVITKTGTHASLHAQKGIFIASNPQYVKTGKIQAAIIDIAPTILTLLGIKRPPIMDGRILHEAFRGIEVPEIDETNEKDMRERKLIHTRIRDLKSKGKV